VRTCVQSVGMLWGYMPNSSCHCDVCITELCKTTGNNCFVVFRVYTENVHVHAERSACRRWVNTDEKCRLSDVELLQQFSIVVYTVPNTTKVFSDYYSCLTHGRGFGPSMSWVGLDEYLSSLYFNVIIILYCIVCRWVQQWMNRV